MVALKKSLSYGSSVCWDASGSLCREAEFLPREENAVSALPHFSVLLSSSAWRKSAYFYASPFDYWQTSPCVEAVKYREVKPSQFCTWCALFCQQWPDKTHKTKEYPHKHTKQTLKAAELSSKSSSFNFWMYLAKFVTLLWAASFQCTSCLCMQPHKCCLPQAYVPEFFLSVPGSTGVEWSCWYWTGPFSGVISLELDNFKISLPIEIITSWRLRWYFFFP